MTDAVAALRRGTAVAAQHLVGRPLFAGLVSLPWPDDPLGQLRHAAVMLREYRGTSTWPSTSPRTSPACR